MPVNVVIGSVVLGQHVSLHDGLDSETEALWAAETFLLRLPAFAVAQVPLLGKLFALGAPHADDPVSAKTLTAVVATIALITDKLQQILKKSF